MTITRSVWSVAGVLFGVSACGGSPARTSTPAGGPSSTTPPANEAQSRTDDASAMCQRMLARFGAAATGEQDDCVRAATVGDDRQACDAAGQLAEFDRCFPACLSSVGITQEDYVVGDAVSNCEGPCRQVSCDQDVDGP